MRITRRRNRDERGATFVLTAICMVTLLSAGAMGLDLGFTVDGNRQAQAIADTGALDMARYINLADNNSSSSNSALYLSGKLANVATDNALNGVTLTEIPGFWSPTLGFTTPPSNGGCYHQLAPHNPPCTAVTVTATENVPRFFFGGPSTVSRSAIGYLNPQAAFSIGSYLFNVNPQQVAVLGAILSSIGTVNLTAVGYEGLANTYVSVNQLIAASGGVLTPSNVLTTNLTPAQWQSILENAAFNEEQSQNCGASPVPSACVAYTALGAGGALTGSMSLTGSSSLQERLCDLVSIDGSATGSACTNSVLSSADFGASLNVLQTLTTNAELQLTNGNSAVDLGSSTGLGGVTDAKLSVDLIQPPQIAYGPSGTTANTAQVSMNLSLSVLGSTYPLVVSLSAANGTAKLGSVTCSQANDSLSQDQITASTTAGAATLSLNGSQVATATATGAGPTVLPFTSYPPTASSFGAPSNANPWQIGTTSPSLNFSVTGTGLPPLVSTLLGATGGLGSSVGLIAQAAGMTFAGASIANIYVDCDSVSLVK